MDPAQTWPAYPELESEKIIGSKFLDHRPDAVVAAATAAFDQFDAARVHIDIVVHDQQIGRLQIEIVKQRGYAAAAAIHIGLRLEQSEPGGADPQRGAESLMLVRGKDPAVPMRQPVDEPEADIVSGLFVFGTGITQACN